MKKSEVAEFFVRAESFMTAFRQVEREGFFEAFSVDIRNNEGYSISFHIQASGLLPDKKQDKLVGVTPYIDPAAVLQTIQAQLECGDYKLQFGNCKSEVKDWPKFDKAGERCIGRRGHAVELAMNGFIKWMHKSRPR
jgi:hypothetical protein